MDLQNQHQKLKCSNDQLVDSFVNLEVAHGVIVTMVKSYKQIDNTCSQNENKEKQSWYEQVIVEDCNDDLALENEVLKQEVERLSQDLSKLKGKSVVQPSQDNRETMVKKLEKGSTVTCSKCHKEGHKSNKCPQPRKKLPDEKNKKKLTIKSSLIYTKPNRKNKSNSTSYVIKKKTNGKVVAHKVGKKERS